MTAAPRVGAAPRGCAASHGSVSRRRAGMGPRPATEQRQGTETRTGRAVVKSDFVVAVLLAYRMHTHLIQPSAAILHFHVIPAAFFHVIDMISGVELLV